MKAKVLFIAGPTAAGKSRLALILAKRIKGEIISADSMQVYRGMDIGTAKPTALQQKQIPHYLIDIIPPSRSFSVYQYRRLALAKIRQVIKKGKFPIVVGGSGLFVRSLLQGLSGQPGADIRLRKSLENEAEKFGLKPLYERLVKLDPARAAKIKSQDKRRILRALEILEQSRTKPSEWYQKRESLASLGFDPLVIGITKERSRLYADIEKRVEQMFRKGLVREVKKLLRSRWSKTARQAVGYKEIIPALRGEISLTAAKDLIKKNTRHFAKRQLTWFKKEQDIEWYELASAADFQKIAIDIYQKLPLSELERPAKLPHNSIKAL